MGMDLKLYPLHNSSFIVRNDSILGEHLRMDADYSIFGQLREDLAKHATTDTRIAQRDLAPGMSFTMYDETGEISVISNPWGVPITYVYAQDLKRLELPEDVSPRNRAVKAYIDELPGDIPIVLWWC